MAAVCILALLLFAIGLAVVYTPCTPPYPERASVTLDLPVVVQRTIDGQTRWDATVDIHKVSPKDLTASWDRIGLAVQGRDGNVLLGETHPSPDDVTGYDDASDSIIDVQIWYVESGSKDYRMSSGDSFKLTGMTASFEGALFKIYFEGERVGDVHLPTVFPRG